MPNWAILSCETRVRPRVVGRHTRTLDAASDPRGSVIPGWNRSRCLPLGIQSQNRSSASRMPPLKCWCSIGQSGSAPVDDIFLILCHRGSLFLIPWMFQIAAKNNMYSLINMTTHTHHTAKRIYNTPTHSHNKSMYSLTHSLPRPRTHITRPQSHLQTRPRTHITHQRTHTTSQILHAHAQHAHALTPHTNAHTLLAKHYTPTHSHHTQTPTHY